MDPALYGLAGVVVGATIGGWTQLRAERSRQRSQRQHELFILRLKAYAELLSTLNELVDHSHTLSVAHMKDA
ncbi:hypothetical protein, partial [Georgenia sp. MJ170]|uniref:hypothetical protein n=1 Tax=Georgenia sunbinii TaxID=3117728 RepID=UPI002F25F08B